MTRLVHIKRENNQTTTIEIKQQNGTRVLKDQNADGKEDSGYFLAQKSFQYHDKKGLKTIEQFEKCAEELGKIKSGPLPKCVTKLAEAYQITPNESNGAGFDIQGQYLKIENYSPGSQLGNLRFLARKIEDPSPVDPLEELRQSQLVDRLVSGEESLQTFHNTSEQNKRLILDELSLRLGAEDGDVSDKAQSTFEKLLRSAQNQEDKKDVRLIIKALTDIFSNKKNYLDFAELGYAKNRAIRLLGDLGCENKAMAREIADVIMPLIRDSSQNIKTHGLSVLLGAKTDSNNGQRLAFKAEVLTQEEIKVLIGRLSKEQDSYTARALGEVGARSPHRQLIIQNLLQEFKLASPKYRESICQAFSSMGFYSEEANNQAVAAIWDFINQEGKNLSQEQKSELQLLLADLAHDWLTSCDFLFKKLEGALQSKENASIEALLTILEETLRFGTFMMASEMIDPSTFYSDPFRKQVKDSWAYYTEVLNQAEKVGGNLGKKAIKIKDQMSRREARLF